METSSRVVCGMVLGEASESDEDSDAPSNTTPANISFLPNNSVTKTPKHKLKYNTLLHYRLRKNTSFKKEAICDTISLLFTTTGDNNISLRNDIVSTVEQPVQKATQKLQESLQIQTKTRASLHEMPRYLHQLSVALVGLQDRLPMICNVKIIPESKRN